MQLDRRPREGWLAGGYSSPELGHRVDHRNLVAARHVCRNQGLPEGGLSKCGDTFQSAAVGPLKCVPTWLSVVV